MVLRLTTHVQRVPVGSDTKQQQCAAALVDIIAKTHISRKRRIDVPFVAGGSVQQPPSFGLFQLEAQFSHGDDCRRSSRNP